MAPSPSPAAPRPHAPPADTALGRGLRLLERVSPALTAELVGRLFRTTPPAPAAERPVAAEARVERIAYVPPRGASRRAERALAVHALGAGPPVVLLHGWAGRASQMGVLAQALAAAGVRALVLEAPGHGVPGLGAHAVGKRAPRRSSLPEFAAALEAAGRAFGPLHGVVAHSLGTAAAALAVRRGLAVERLVFLAPPLDLDVYFFEYVRAFGLRPRTYERLIRAYERCYGFDWQGLRHVTHAAPGPQALLVAHDEDDREAPIEGGRAVAAAWPHARLLATRGLGHRRLLRDPAVVAAVVRHLAPAEGAQDPGS